MFLRRFFVVIKIMIGSEIIIIPVNSGDMDGRSSKEFFKYSSTIFVAAKMLRTRKITENFPTLISKLKFSNSLDCGTAILCWVLGMLLSEV